MRSLVAHIIYSLRRKYANTTLPPSGRVHLAFSKIERVTTH